MPDTFTPSEFAQMNRLDQPNPYLWILEMEVPTAPVSRYRLNNQAHPIEWGTDGDGNPLTYSPFPFSVSGLRRDAQGRQQSITVTASNVTRELQAAIESFDGLIGQPARLGLLHKALLSSGTPMLEIKGEIITHSAPLSPAGWIAFEIGEASLYAENFPRLRISPIHCSHDYGGILCGYNTGTSGALQTCSKLIEGVNGCREHGEAEDLAGLEVLHPRRFGGTPGVPRDQGAGL